MAITQYYDKNLKLPSDIAHKISLRAAELARQYAPRGPRNSRSRIRATSSNGQVGIYIPPGSEHLLYLDKGIAPFVMYSLEGKTIPIRNADGSISFRKAKGVGKTKITARDKLGRIISSDKKWKHPGIQPLNFIDRALNQAVEEWIDSIQKEDVLQLLNQFPEFRELMQMFSATMGSRVNYQRS